MTTLGFIGLGNMGHPMAMRLVRAGMRVCVHDARPGQAAALAGAGAHVADSARAVGDQADLVLLSLPTPAALLSVVGDDAGLARGTRVRQVVDLSTVGPAAAIEVARLLAPSGKSLVDAPVSGGVSGAEAGTLAIMTSGPAADLDLCEPTLRHLGRVIRVGQAAGQGQAMKLLNNLLSATAMAATAEVMALGVKAGLDPAVMLDVLNASSGRNTATTDKFPRSVMDRSFNFGFRTVLLHKDVRLCRDFAEENGVAFDVGSAVEQAWARAATELGDADFTRIVELVERQAGVTIGAPKGGQ